MKHYFLLFVLFVSFSSVFSQSNFKQGYIITNEKDTVYGLIDFRTDRMNFERCEYKESETANTRIYYPGEIAGYRFVEEGKFYVTHSIMLEDSISRIVFLEYLIEGVKNVYYYKDTYNQQEYYFFEEDDDLVLITKKRDKLIAAIDMEDRLPFENASYRSVEDTKYRGILTYMFKDQPELGKEIRTLPFKRDAMVELAKNYHNLACEVGEECIVFENNYKQKFVKFIFSVYGGLQQVNYASDQQARYEMLYHYSTTSLFPVIGGQMNILNPRWSKSISLQLDLSFSGMNGSGEQTINYSTYTADRRDNIKALMGTMKFGIKYTVPIWKIRPTIEAGGNYISLFNRSSSSYVEETKKSNGELTIKNLTDNIAIQRALFGWYAGVGFNYMLKNENAIFLRVLYERGNRTQSDVKANKHLIYKDKLEILQLKVGYIF